MDKKIIIISALIAVLAIIAAGSGIFRDGLYKNDTKSGAAQLVGNDLVTLLLCVPMLLISAYYTANGSLRSKLIWMGTIFYFLYVYAMLSFMAAYNQLFLVYVAIYSLCMFTFVWSLITLDAGRVQKSLTNAPIKLAAGFMFLIVLAVSAMWLSIVIGSLMSGERPAILETYTTLVIQAMDLGIIVPLAAITGILLLKKNAWGYALASLVLIKGITLGTAVLSMALFMWLNGVEIVIPQVIMFVVLVLISIALAILFYGKMKDPGINLKKA
jgi:hypothetical protein